MKAVDFREESVPRVSVVMPVFRESDKQLKRSITSVLEQTFTDFEFIILLDDPSNSNARKLIHSFLQEDERIVFLEPNKHLGVALALNMMVSRAKGEYIARQDADDASYINRLEAQITYLDEHHNVDVVGTSIRYVDEQKGNTLLVREYAKDISQTIAIESPVAHPTIVAKKSTYYTYGMYDAEMRYVEDYDLWIRWYTAGVSFSNIPYVLYDHYQGSTNTKNRKTKKQLSATIRLKWLYRKELKFSVYEYIVLGAECALVILPSSLIRASFYWLKNSRVNKLLYK